MDEISIASNEGIGVMVVEARNPDTICSSPDLFVRSKTSPFEKPMINQIKRGRFKPTSSLFHLDTKNKDRQEMGHIEVLYTKPQE